MQEKFKDFFKRQIQLFGEEKQKALQDKKIAIIGSGGLGSSLALALGASGIGDISLVDFDKVSFSNIHRQVAFKLCDENKYKAELVKELIEARNPYVTVKAFIEDFDTFSKRNLTFDLIIDATDNLPTRASIDSWCKKNKQIWLYGSVEEFHGQICLFDKASYEAVFKINDRKPKGIACPIVMQIASFQANLALRFLAGLEVKKDILYYLSFSKEGVFSSKSFNLPLI